MEKIYMIPVNDAYSGASECPFCALKNKAENDYLEYYLGPSLMEPDTRKITNKTGFCPEHMGKLNKSVTNRLGLGLVMHTHLLDFHEDISKDMINSAPSKAGLLKGRSSDYKSKLNDIADRSVQKTAGPDIDTVGGDRRVFLDSHSDFLLRSLKHFLCVITVIE